MGPPTGGEIAGYRPAAMRRTGRESSPAPQGPQGREQWSPPVLRANRPIPAPGTKPDPLGNRTHPPAVPRSVSPRQGDLELRRTRTASPERETAERAAREGAELAVRRQAPELQLLRRQSQEQERMLQAQKQDLTGLKQRLERQEAAVRKAVERARVPGAEEPGQVRQLAKAVMKELESQLRLERQRRGLI